MQQLVEIQFLYMVSAITKTKHIYFMCEIPKRIKMCLNDPQIWHLIFQTKLQDHLKEKKKEKNPTLPVQYLLKNIFEKFCTNKIYLFTHVKDQFINQTSAHDVWNGLCHQHHKLLQLPVLRHITTLNHLP